MNRPSKNLRATKQIDFPTCLFGIRLLAILALVLCCPVSSMPVVSAAGGGWYLEGPPIIEKSRFVDSEFYFGQKLSVSDGSASGTVNWSDGGR